MALVRVFGPAPGRLLTATAAHHSTQTWAVAIYRPVFYHFRLEA
jgi:hypothetical protein